ncbi:MAG: IS21 family transposase [Bacteroidetes bacterium]|nr:IS21 family transposase [Bacteroidota bacterium]
MSIKAISRELGVSRNTVRRYLRSKTIPEPQARSAKPTKLDGYRGYLPSRVEAAHPDWIPATVLFAEVAALGYSGCVRSVSGYLATLKPKRQEDPLVRFETAPGRQMQVDWGAFRLNGQRVSLFLATLGWSRFNFGLFVDNEQFETLRDCHEQAFDAFGGVPLEVLYDNMRTVVQQRNAYGRGLHRFHPGLHDLAHSAGRIGGRRFTDLRTGLDQNDSEVLVAFQAVLHHQLVPLLEYLDRQSAAWKQDRVQRKER